MCENVKPLTLLKHDLIDQVNFKVVEINTVFVTSSIYSAGHTEGWSLN